MQTDSYLVKKDLQPVLLKSNWLVVHLPGGGRNRMRVAHMYWAVPVGGTQPEGGMDKLLLVVEGRLRAEEEGMPRAAEEDKDGSGPVEDTGVQEVEDQDIGSRQGVVGIGFLQGEEGRPF